MTGHWCDFQNADVIMSCGSNNLENHPISSHWTHRAQDRGAKWIVVDPRFTRTAEMADLYCPIRSGTDIAFYGGMIHYIIEHELWQHEYVLNYTNASYLIDPKFDFDVETGLFSGWNAEKKAYDKSSWGYQVDSTSEWDTSEGGAYAWAKAEGVPAFTPPKVKTPKKDPTLQDPNCVFQLMKRHYERYTIEKVCSICGMDPETLEEVYSIFCSTGKPGKAGTILYALGQTQHHYGAQNTRIMCMIQMLLGNAGVSGGGLNALRGEPNVQGATDMGMTVYDTPGYMRWPNAFETRSLREWCEHETYAAGYYTNKPKFMVSFLKEWFGEAATVENDYGYDWLPKIPKNGDDYTTMGTFHLMDAGIMKGYFTWGHNPVHSDPNAKFSRNAMKNLDWLVVADWFYTETSTFWRAPDINPAEVKTECYFLPAALIYEKSGSILNSGRWIQQRYKAVDPVGDAKPDFEICDILRKAIVAEYQKGGVFPEGILNTKWDYYVDGKIDPRPVAWALNGYTVKDGKLLKTFGELKADGSTSSAMWIYGGFYSNNDAKLDPSKQPTGSRLKDDPGNMGLYPKFAFSWPANRRVLYNRASADMNGKPWNPDKALVWWDGEKWQYNDVPDFAISKKDADGNTVPVPPDNKAFIMKWEGNGNLLTTGMKDAPLPEHYEPFEGPVGKNPMNGSLNSPMIKFADHPSAKRSDSATYPIVATTYSVTEHWQSGTQTRSVPALDEIVPKQFVEMSTELAEAKGIKNGDEVRVYNERGSVKVHAMVTRRLRPITVDGKTVHQVGLVHHWGWEGMYSTGDVVNDLTPNVGDPNSFIPEFKAFLVNVEKA
ncbi:molybdopterin-dependent oxidoreductase [Eggerthellaceae bacterium zg-997]|nr:molybdopterin-dependent oxidoreductase [Berryella wangjianweii]NPD32196.1 molybdopterin-dependent oxidoreductase [Eggerthellaceae bacterium zg-997]